EYSFHCQARGTPARAVTVAVWFRRAHQFEAPRLEYSALQAQVGCELAQLAPAPAQRAGLEIYDAFASGDARGAGFVFERSRSFDRAAGRAARRQIAPAAQPYIIAVLRHAQHAIGRDILIGCEGEIPFV